MANIITQCCDKWSRPILFHLLATGLVVCSIVVRVRPFFYLSLFLLAVTSVGLIISAVYQFSRKQKKEGIVTVLILIASIVGLVVVAIAIGFYDIAVNNVQL